jgi:hypothetical protein
MSLAAKQTRSERVAALADLQIVQCPHPEVAAGQRADRRPAGHVLVLRFFDGPGPDLHLGHAAHGFGERGGQILHEHVDGVEGIQAFLDQRRDVFESARQRPARQLLGASAGQLARLGCQFPLQTSCVFAHDYSPRRASVSVCRNGRDEKRGKKHPIVCTETKIQQVVEPVPFFIRPRCLSELVYTIRTA